MTTIEVEESLGVGEVEIVHGVEFGWNGPDGFLLLSLPKTTLGRISGREKVLYVSLCFF